MNINVIIPARKGSKGIKNKNLACVNNIPLFERSINHAIELNKYFPVKIWLSTDHPSIIKYENNFDNLFIHKRDKCLAGDKTLTYEVVLDIIKKYSIPENELIILFQPTSPFRKIKEICEAIKLLNKNDYFKSAVSLISVEGNHPFRMKRLNKENETFDFIDQGFENMMPRQSLPKVYIRSGNFYISFVSSIKKEGNLLPKPCKGIIHNDKKCAINIDNEIDLFTANYFAKND